MRKNRQLAASARRKHIKLQHHKMNTRRQFYFNQQLGQEVLPTTKEH